jgi:hypothetical protein
MESVCGLRIGDRVYFHNDPKDIGTVTGYLTADINRQLNELEYRNPYDETFVNWALVKMDKESDYCSSVRQLTGASYVASVKGPERNVILAYRPVSLVGINELI